MKNTDGSIYYTWISQAFILVNRYLVQAHKHIPAKEKCIAAKEISQLKIIIFSAHLTMQEN